MTNGPVTEVNRFIIPREGLINERLHKIKDSVNNLKQQYPEIQSLCVFGSTVNGKMRTDSDIDGFLFFDLEAMEHKLGSNTLQTSYLSNVWNYDKGTIADFGGEYRSQLRSTLQDHMGLEGNQVNDIFVFGLSNSIIDARIKQLQKKGLSPAIKTKLVSLNQDIPVELYGIFHFMIGNGVGKYRKYLIESLCSMGTEGDRLWNLIIGKVEQWENSGELNSGKKYPHSLTQAKELYT